jgi:hypothetical protein
MKIQAEVFWVEMPVLWQDTNISEVHAASIFVVSQPRRPWSEFFDV